MSFLPGDDSGRLNGVSFVRLVIPGKEVVTASGAGLNTSAERRPATLGIRVERYKERWNPKELSELARHLRDFADTLEDSRRGGKRKATELGVGDETGCDPARTGEPTANGSG